MDAPAALAVDIGATKLAVGLVGSDGRVQHQERAASPRRVSESLALLDTLAKRALDVAEAQGRPVSGVGIACGGPLDLARGLVLAPPNLPDWTCVPIRDRMADLSGAPAYLQNDAGAGAIASYLWDNPDHAADVTYVTVSSGVGCGVILDRALMTGHSGNGSELGHIPLIYGGRPCKCGQAGCVEAYVSGTSIGERYAEAHGGPAVTAHDIADRAAQGDNSARAHWIESMQMLNRVIRAAVDLFDPALVCLGGGVTDADAALLAPALDFGGTGGMSDAVGRGLSVRRTGFGRDSGVVSAAAVAWNEIGAADGRRVALRQEV
ncbi:ROK family protein [Psychromarinibacter halotolerans]|uniref:ROK family protein n=1 Tax=Psychromarinibacter halotolerans TaxID=1775175 RepID=A0ABV7GX59_9RHOB|nr:ROK family protein [Psychromarinibacter halotolerans]MDF0595151.1 ROK family protein [Psychromarinibacter halotolerans]